MPINPSLWQVHWQANFQPAVINTVYFPLPPVDIPIAFQKPLVAISTSSFDANPKWNTAGWVSQKINTGLTIAGTPDAIFENSKWLRLNKLNLFLFPMELASTYTLNLSFPRWMKDLSVAVWEYQGDISATDISSTLLRIEQKVDDIVGGF